MLQVKFESGPAQKKYGYGSSWKKFPQFWSLSRGLKPSSDLLSRTLQKYVLRAGYWAMHRLYNVGELYHQKNLFSLAPPPFPLWPFFKWMSNPRKTWNLVFLLYHNNFTCYGMKITRFHTLHFHWEHAWKYLVFRTNWMEIIIFNWTKKIFR